MARQETRKPGLYGLQEWNQFAAAANGWQRTNNSSEGKNLYIFKLYLVQPHARDYIDQECPSSAYIMMGILAQLGKGGDRDYCYKMRIR